MAALNAPAAPIGPSGRIHRVQLSRGRVEYLDSDSDEVFVEIKRYEDSGNCPTAGDEEGSVPMKGNDEGGVATIRAELPLVLPRG